MMNIYLFNILGLGIFIPQKISWVKGELIPNDIIGGSLWLGYLVQNMCVD